jgi:c-di-GMP-binding flagellar brake protein YcgR
MPHYGSTVQSDQRQSKRKILKVKALLAIEGGARSMAGRTVDLSGEGVSVIVPDSVPPGAHGQVRFEIFHDGKATQVHARARVQYCILSNGEYKLGLQFVNLELSAMAAVSRFLQ